MWITDISLPRLRQLQMELPINAHTLYSNEHNIRKELPDVDKPFAGIYSTYMIPYLEDKYQMLQMLACAIKGVYASVFYRDSKAYM